MKICFLETRPELIKMAPVIKECERNNLNYFILHTGQHYSYEMYKVFFEELNLPKPKYNLEKNSYILVTAHRPESVDDIRNLRNILKRLELIYEKFNIQIIFPIYSRTRSKIKEFNLEIPKGIMGLEPQGYLEFLQLMGNAKLLITDSGGLQEEACILKVPCVTIREATERPETLEVGSNIIAGYDPIKILKYSEKMMNKERNWEGSVKLIDAN